MKNLRIVSATVNDSTTIDVVFTDTLVNNLSTSNVTITSDNLNPSVLKIRISKDTLRITCQPLTPFTVYTLTFQSTITHPFISLHGTARILEDGVSNKCTVKGLLEVDNPIKKFLQSYFKDNIYSLDEGTLIAKAIDNFSVYFSRALHDIRQVKNEKYLSFNVIDEKKVRGVGPFDRLNEESAYEILRVGRNTTTANVSSEFTNSEFPSFPITLQRQTNTESLTIGSTNDVGILNVNTLVLNLSFTPVTKITSLSFVFSSATPNYTYDIETLGYQINDSRYDQDYASSYAQLDSNQVKLNEQILSDANFDFDKIFSISITYESKNKGLIIDPTVTVTTVTDVTRETLPPIVNVFNLKYAPIVLSNNTIPDLAGITFTDPNSTGSHPAFLYEIPFRLSYLPSVIGQYAIDYNTGTVYVYGADSNKDGTGAYPPLATYKYRFTYNDELDYVYDSTLSDIVALPGGNLVENSGTVSFSYEEVLVPDVDYVSNLHIESLNERIENRLLSSSVLRTSNTPITNVFQVLNETSGEIYTIDRFSDDKVYFKFNNAPNIIEFKQERVQFRQVSNELLFVNTTYTNASIIKVFKIFLNNGYVVSATEDCLGSSFNTSLQFSDTDIFVNEKYFIAANTETQNIDRLTTVGQFTVDYTNGLVYIAVSNTQGFNLGTASYKNNDIDLVNPHIISVDDIYYRITTVDPKNKLFSYSSFDEDSVIPESLDKADELYLNASDVPYQISSNQVGIFDPTFIAGVTNQIKFTRSIFEYSDLSNSTHPLNFSAYSTSTDFDITIAPITGSFVDTVKHDVDGYYINVNQNIPYLSANITYTFTISRISDSASLWNGSGTVTVGNPVKLILPGINTPLVGDLVTVTYSFEINDLSRVVIDYNKGDFFIDYTYLADEILVSYEYGDNVIDFRQNINLSEGSEYYVSYRVGALRDALIRNFGNLINVAGLVDPDLSFDRERYRDALTAALTSFLDGPTVSAIQNIGKKISHIQPEINESVFDSWSLGSSLLYPQEITTTGTIELLPAKFGNGAMIDSDQTIQFPITSNIRLEEGTFETWLSPNWNGLDNDATLEFTILDDGYEIDPARVFLGAAETHPTLTSGKFSLTKLEAVGTPNTNKDGIFIYYENDISGNYQRWYVNTVDGYVNAASSYTFKITSDGKFYNTNKSESFSLFTGSKSLTFTMGGASSNKTLNFISDKEHYLLDFGEETKNRLSIFKDATGYLNFKVIDNKKDVYQISTNVSSWEENTFYHVAASWKINTRNNQDEMHLFINGTEVPNIVKFGQNYQSYLHEKFQTVIPEDIIGSTTKDIIASTDLVVTSGSAIVSSAINFSALNISPGDIIFIDETGFSSTGYSIVSIGGQSLTLNTTMPATLTAGRFSINRTEYTIDSEIDIASNIAISTIHYLITGTCSGTISTDTITSATNFVTSEVEAGYLLTIDGYSDPFVILSVSTNSLVLNRNLSSSIIGANFHVYTNTENELPGLRAVTPSYSISQDGYYNNILTISNSVLAGDLILVRTLGLNFQRVRKSYYVWSDQQENVLLTQLPAPIALEQVNITKVIVPKTNISSANSTTTLSTFYATLPVTQPTNAQVGRTLSATIAGNNVDFTTPVQVIINGVVGVYTVSETLTFTDYGTVDSTNLFLSLTSIQVVTKPTNLAKSALTLTVKEKYPITQSELSALVPVVKYSYETNSGTTLYNDGYASVRDENNLFSGADINNYLIVQSPIIWAGYYVITAISEDRKSLTIEPTNQAFPLPVVTFTNGIYKIVNTTQYRSGLQNGFFTLEASVLPSQEYFLSSGYYEFDYNTYATIKLDPLSGNVFLGSDLNSTNQINGLIDQVKIYSTMLTDTRIGESIPSTQRSITKDYNSLKALKKDSNTLMLLTFDELPIINSSDFYIKPTTYKNHFQSSEVVNDNFGESVVFLTDPLIIPNDGILDTRKESTIEFWTNPMYDTGNDPNKRFYFDAYGAVVEEVVSTNNLSVKLSSSASQILSVKLKTGSDDYFAGGQLEIDTQRAIVEVNTSSSNNTVAVTKDILQVISVKIVSDLTEVDYFNEGSIGSDKRTIYLNRLLPSATLQLKITYQTTAVNAKNNTQIIRLNKKLPYHQTTVLVSYIPKGLQGDRIALFKDELGFMNFGITASGIDYVVQMPTRWAKNTWHRVKASYKVNSGIGNDELRLFLDGYQSSKVIIGTNLISDQSPVITGGSIDGYELLTNIKFKDSINDLFFGSQYTSEFPIFALVDNLRISNKSRPIYSPYGEPLDVNYSSNLSMAFPVTEDLYTTYLLDFDSERILNKDFAFIKNRETGQFDFSINVFDSFGIINGSIKSKEILETLIKVLKPANSRVYIQYSR